MSRKKKRYAEGVYEKWNSGVDKAFGGANAKERLLWFISNAASAFCAFVLCSARIPFFMNALGSPLCDAYLCASGRGAVGAFAGAIYAVFSSSALPSEYIILLAVLAIRFVFSRLGTSNGGFLTLEGSSGMRAASCAVLSILRVSTALMQTGFENADWATLSRTLIYAPFICFFLLFYFSGELGSGLRKVMYHLSGTVLFCAFVYCASQQKMFGGSLGVIAAVFLTLAVSRCKGAIWGCVLGALLGAFVSLDVIIPISVIGVLSGLLFLSGAPSPVGFAAAAGAAVYVFTNGLLSSVDFVTEVLIATAVASPILKYRLLPSDFPFKTQLGALPSVGMENVYPRLEASKRLLNISKTISELADPCRELSQKCSERIRADFCESCPMSPICWESERSKTETAIFTLSEQCFSDEAVLSRSVPEWLGEHCIKIKDLCAETEKVSRDIAFAEKNRRSILSGELERVSGILSSVAGELDNENTMDAELARRINRALVSIGVSTNGACVLGKERKKIIVYGLTRPDSDEAEDKLIKTISRVCGEELCEPVYDGKRAIFMPSVKFSAESASAGVPKRGETQSGDKAVSFSDGSLHYSIIADGMGSGAEAAICAEYASGALERLLSEGIDKLTAVQILGSLLKRRFPEMLAAIDIMKIDLFSGRAEFVKNGAAESYILRGGAVYPVGAQSLPIGIIQGVLSEETEVELRDGDTVVMISDGLYADGTNGEWIKTALMSGDLKSPELLASDIIDFAVKTACCSDDMTVTVTKIRKAS